MNTLQCMVWDTILDPLWQEQNEIKHRKYNEYNAAEDEQSSTRIVPYVDHMHELVDYYDQFLA